MRALIGSSCCSRSPTDDRRSGPKDRGLLVWGRAGAHSGSVGLRCLSLQFTSPSARFGVAAFISGGRRCYTHLPPVIWHSAFSIGARAFFCFSISFWDHCIARPASTHTALVSQSLVGLCVAFPSKPLSLNFGRIENIFKWRALVVGSKVSGRRSRRRGEVFLFVFRFFVFFLWQTRNTEHNTGYSAHSTACGTCAGST